MPKSLHNFDQYINQALEEWHIPGAAVAIAKGDQLLHSGGYGFRDLERGLPISDDTRFPIASMTKAFTAMGAALLVDEGLLEWDQALRDVLPEFRLADEYATQHATLRDLLSHRTGLPRHDATWYGHARPRRELIAGLRHLSPSTSFRGAWQYNNLMYETVGHLCARVSDSEHWPDFIQQRVIDPLGLESTTANAPEGACDVSDIALPYHLPHGERQPKRIPFFENPQGLPAGSMYSTVQDLLVWLRLHLSDGMHRGSRFISAHQLKQMHTPHMVVPATVQQERLFANRVYTYGLGWHIDPYQGRTLIHHGGNIDGFSVIGAFVPQEDIAIVVLTNIDGNALRYALMYEALDRALGLEGKDWSREYLKLDRINVQAAQKSRRSSAAERIASAPPSHPLATYAGTYSAGAYVDIEIKWEHDALWAWHWGRWFPLNHYHHNVFEIDMQERYQSRLKVTFGLDDLGNIAHVQVPIESALSDVLFKRKPLQLDESQRRQVLGHYRHPLEGQQVIISQKNENLYYTQTGQPSTTLHCVEQTAACLRFKLAGNAHSVVEVVLDNNGASAVLIKHPDALFECPRIETDAAD